MASKAKARRTVSVDEDILESAKAFARGVLRAAGCEDFDFNNAASVDDLKIFSRLVLRLDAASRPRKPRARADSPKRPGVNLGWSEP